MNLPTLVAQLDACLTSDQKVVGSTPLSRQHFFMEIDHEFSTVILSLPSKIVVR